MKRIFIVGVIILSLILIVGAFIYMEKKNKDYVSRPAGDNFKTMKITSESFENNGNIPAKFTCDGQKINPGLAIGGVPSAAKSLALIIDDPDANNGTFTHWTLWNIAPDTAIVAENSVPPGAVQGLTSLGKAGYVPPCPPSGIHHYRFNLYALDIEIGLSAGAKLSDLEEAMRGHVIDKAEMAGLYRRN
jgi:Raf kinase inhibitor-like YbhB/YbcL family protein